MGSSMTCKQQYCCGNMRDCTGPEDTPTPSMDDKHIPSPPTRTTEQYEADKESGVQPVGFPVDKKGL